MSDGAGVGLLERRRVASPFHGLPWFVRSGRGQTRWLRGRRSDEDLVERREVDPSSAACVYVRSAAALRCRSRKRRSVGLAVSSMARS